MKPACQKTWSKGQITAGALPITRDELIALGVPAECIEKGEYRGEVKCVGPWQLPVSYKALCMSAVWTPEDRRRFNAERESETVYGMRILISPRESGYALQGFVSVNGRKVRGFTSSQLFELPDGKLVTVATIHACIDTAEREETP